MFLLRERHYVTEKCMTLEVRFLNLLYHKFKTLGKLHKLCETQFSPSVSMGTGSYFTDMWRLSMSSLL